MTEPFVRAARRRSWGLAALTAVLVVALDQATKQLVVATIDRGHPVDLPLGFHLANVRNDGVAFGLLGGAGTLVLILTLVTMAVLLGYFAVRASEIEQCRNTVDADDVPDERREGEGERACSGADVERTLVPGGRDECPHLLGELGRA